MLLRRYACPRCGGGLSRTLFHPAWVSLDSGAPEFRVPLARLILAFVLLGLGLGLIHPALGVAAVVALGGWVHWRYFAWLQCDDCGCFWFGGQLGRGLRATRPWTRRELEALALKISVAGAVFGVVFAPLRVLEYRTAQHCAVDCARAGSIGQARLFRCTCVPKPR